MKKIFLASALPETIDLALDLLPSHPKDLNLAFISTAADPYEDKSWIHQDRQALEERGFNIVDVDIKNKTKEDLEQDLADYDVICVGGGNTYYLLEKMRKSKFDEVLKSKLEQGVVYIGSSAGAVVVCPTIDIAQKFDDSADAPELTDYSGLNLVDFLVLPHYEKTNEVYVNVYNEWKEKGYKVFPISNTQAIVVNDSEVTTVGE